MRGLVVLGTDTGVGKTVFSTLLLSSLRRQGLAVEGMKPVETGCDLQPLDALSLAIAAGSRVPLDVVCPYRFRMPAAPRAAAEAEGAVIDPVRIRSAFDDLARGGRFVLVECAGGAGTPYGPDLVGLDIARLLDLPALLVARAALGTVGQCVVTVRAMAAAGVTCRGVVLVRLPGMAPGPEDPTNAPLIEAHAQVPVHGILPVLPAPPSPLDVQGYRGWADRSAAILERSVDVGALLR